MTINRNSFAALLAALISASCSGSLHADTLQFGVVASPIDLSANVSEAILPGSTVFQDSQPLFGTAPDPKQSAELLHISSVGINPSSHSNISGAFASSLARRVPRLLWQHDMHEPIGKVLGLTEDDRGLHGEFKISRTTRGHDAYQLLRDGAIDSMSIGYIPDEQDFDEKSGVRQLKSVELLEISLVSIPMNGEARITAVKAARVSEPVVSGPTIASLRLQIARKRLERIGVYV